MSDGDNGRKREAIAGAALGLAARHGWRQVTLGMIARDSGVLLTDLSLGLSGRQAIYEAIAGVLEQRALDEGDALSVDETSRDRLFAMMMASFDMLAVHRAGALDMLESLRRDPARLIWGWHRLCGASQTVLSHVSFQPVTDTAKGVAAAHPDRPCRKVRRSIEARVLAGLWLTGLRAWMRDPSPDMAATMAALDQALDRAERLRHVIRDPAGAINRLRDRLRAAV
jgi:ubiquinone biosynthesis protein COQ9